MPAPRRLLLLAALTLSGMMLLAQPTSATAPSIETFHGEGSSLFADCGAFQLTSRCRIRGNRRKGGYD